MKSKFYSAEHTHASGTPSCQGSKDSNNKITQHLIYIIHSVTLYFQQLLCQHLLLLLTEGDKTHYVLDHGISADFVVKAHGQKPGYRNSPKLVKVSDF